MAKSIGGVYEYDGGQTYVQFIWVGHGQGGYVWSHKRQQSLADYRRLCDLRAAYERSQNDDGAYGCAELRLAEEE